jgi:RNA polymerase sigma factor (sigma-70 family)
MTPLSNPQIVGGVNRKEGEAIDWVRERFTGLITQLIQKLTNDSPDTADLVSDTFIRLLKTKRKFRTPKNIKQFLFVTARNLSLGLKVKQQRAEKHAYGISKMYPVYEDPQTEAAENAAEYISLIYQAIEQLPRQRRNIFILYYKDGLSNPEIAIKLGITEKSVANEKAKALRMLKMEFRPKRFRTFLLNLFL